MRKDRKGRAWGRRNFGGVVDMDSSIVVADVCIRRFGGRIDEECLFEGSTRTMRLDMTIFDILNVPFFADFFRRTCFRVLVE